ncbi:MAG: beta-lactamase family protein [Longispora sp.]|nr:beta-lactamase family protein [Longispora sp. (in: high G+C Gram-positive bacteria)]
MDASFIDSAVAQVMASHKIPGITVSLVAPGKVFLRSYGDADTTSKRKLAPSDHIRIGDISTTFVSTLAIRLMEQGTLAFDATLEQYVPGIPNGSSITVKQLLGMQSGVFNFLDDQEFAKAFNENPLLPDWKPENIVPILQRNPARFAPGQKTEYSQSNPILLGLVIQKVTQQPIENLLEEYIVKPLGIGSSTIFPITSIIADPYSKGYNQDKDVTASNPKVLWTSGGMISTVPELTKYSKLLATGNLLSRELLAERLKLNNMENPGGPPIRYGLGIMTVGHWIGHNGSAPGYGAVMLYLPQSDATLVVMTNQGTPTSENATSLFLALAQQLYPDSLQL